MYFYDVQGFYNKPKSIEGFTNSYSNSKVIEGLLGVNVSTQQTPPAQPPAQQSGFVSTNVSTEQTAQTAAQQPAQQSGFVSTNVSTQQTAQAEAQQPAQQPAQQTSLFGVNVSVDQTPPAQQQDQGQQGQDQQGQQVPRQQGQGQQVQQRQGQGRQGQSQGQQGQRQGQVQGQQGQQGQGQGQQISNIINNIFNNSLFTGYVSDLVTNKFTELNNSQKNTNKIVNMKTYTLKDPEVFIINDETKANSYNQESSKIFRVFYKPKLEKSKILIEISSYYDISGTHKDKFECEINVSEDKNHYTDSKGGKRIAIRKIRFEKQIGGGARSGSFFPSGIFKNNNTKPKYFHFNVKREGSDDRFKLARGKNSNFLDVEGLIKIIEIRED